jgi:hypothetical protein
MSAYIYETTLRLTPEDSIPHSHYRANLKSYEHLF